MDKLKQTLLHSSARFQWDKVGIYSHHGIDLPVSALRSKQSCGIGEYYDLMPLIDWCHDHKIDVIMLLPLNETSATDPSPYNAISSCALHPVYLSLENLPFLSSYPEIRSKLSQFKSLNTTQHVQYHEVYVKKFAWLKEYYETVKLSLLEDPAFHSFRESQKSWLETYALFKILKERASQASWTTWAKQDKSPTRKEFEALTHEHREEILFHSALQFHCFEQLRNIKNYANVKGVFFKGDIPILLNPDSADVWADPVFFDMTMTAGTPPDSFSVDGQNWGFPLFNWEIMRRFTENFGWWKTRIAYADNFYDIFRIDHIVGFFRLWGIPLNRPPKEGHYIPSESSLWIPQGREILEFINSNSNMLPIGEDLGSVPNDVKDCLQTLGICGTKIIRWEKDHGEYIPYSHYPILSMSSVSTHDTDTLKGWWTRHPDEAQAFSHFKKWTYSPTLSFDHHKELLRDCHHTPSLFHINLLQEYLALFPELVWPSTDDERINVPGTLNAFNWTYRFRPSVEEIVAHAGLNKAMDEIIR
jgi:4-alpha-glucanotransferase